MQELIRTLLRFTMNGDVIYTRRRIRKFQDRPVSREIIEAVIQAGSAAPSAKNRLIV